MAGSQGAPGLVNKLGFIARGCAISRVLIFVARTNNMIALKRVLEWILYTA